MLTTYDGISSAFFPFHIISPLIFLKLLGDLSCVFIEDEDFNHPRVINLKDKIKNWDDTFDYIDQMDIVVSSCTSLIHAAGAMGKLSVVLTPLLNYYTWAIPGHKTKWYNDNLTIFRQKRANCELR